MKTKNTPNTSTSKKRAKSRVVASTCTAITCWKQLGITFAIVCIVGITFMGAAFLTNEQVHNAGYLLWALSSALTAIAAALNGRRVPPQLPSRELEEEELPIDEVA